MRSCIKVSDTIVVQLEKDENCTRGVGYNPRLILAGWRRGAGRADGTMRRVRWAAWTQVELALSFLRGSSTSRSSPAYSCSFPLRERSNLNSCSFSSSSQGEPPKDGEKPPRPKKMRRRERFGTYDKTFEDELDMVPLEKVSLIYTILVVSSISGWATPPLTQYSQIRTSMRKGSLQT